MESLSLSHSVVNNLNATLSENTQIQRHLQTGRKIINNQEDSGGLGSITRLNSTVLRNQAIQQNLQGSLSLLQAQDGMFKVIGNILDRSAELKTKFNSTMYNKHEKAYYDDEFTELQHELRQIAQSKWNGVSLFSTQDSKTLFGKAVDGQTIDQESSDDGSGNTITLSRWGIYHLDPDDEPPPIKKKFLAMTLTDEAQGAPDGYNGGGGKGQAGFDSDITEWNSFLSDQGIEAEIAVIVNEMKQGAGAPQDPDGGEILPAGMNEATDMPTFSRVFRGAGRDEYALDPGTPTIMPNSADQANFLMNAFEQMTNGGTELPDALGVFVDNSGSLEFRNVNQGLFEFMDRVRATYPSVILPSDTYTTAASADVVNFPEGENIPRSQTGVFKGISLAGREDWIHQSKIALENLINNDPNIAAAVQPTFGEPTYELDDYTIEDFEGFMESLATARAQNGAEQSRIKHELDELQNKQVGLEQALERADGLDYSLAMARYSKSRDQLHLTANLVSAAREMENTLYTDFLNE
ncbi:MAG: hypothetical protein HOH25_10175 [Opitutae bacterium]|nr:hypothetical protein [Opitutae bacterium]